MDDAAPNRHPFSYAVIRVVPRIERGECVNVGVVLFCRPLGYLGARFAFDSARLRAFASNLDVAPIRDRLLHLEHVASGDARAGMIADLTASERFGWLVAPTSTIVQPGPVHAGIATDPAAALEHLFGTMVM